MFFIQYLAEYSIKSWSVLDPEVSGFKEKVKVDSIKVGFTHGDTDWSRFVLEYLGEMLPQVEVIKFPELNQTEFINETAKGVGNKVSVLFCTEFIEVANTTYPCALPNSTKTTYIYNLIYNFTYPSEIFFIDTLQKETIAVKVLLDNAILKWTNENKGLETNDKVLIEPFIQSYPVIDRYFFKYNIISTSGSNYLIITGFLLCALLIMEIVKEKAEFIKVYLHLNEVSMLEYWVSWLAIGACIGAICAIEVPVIGYLLGFEEFSKIPMVFMVTLFFLTNLSCLFIGALIAVSINSVRLGYTFSFSLILAGFVMQGVACNPALIKVLNQTDSELWVSIIKWLLQAYPPYNFAVVYYKLTSTAGLHIDYSDRIWVAGRDFTFDDLFVEDSGTLYNTFSYSMPAVINNVLYILEFIIVSIILLWYLDNVVQNNRSNTKKWYFFVYEEKKNTGILAEPLLDHYLKTVKLSKSYKSLNAVVEFSIEAVNNDVIAIIGQNGAGKSTLLGMIAGYIEKSSGMIQIKPCRLCPQQNVIWDNLTVKEHIELYSSINKSNDLSCIDKSKLRPQENTYAGTLSGGMKRRLTLAISILGSPCVLLLDEPTTGLDPIVRKEIWKFINDVRKDKLVIFTSHSMEEVEFLAKNVIVMNQGKTLHHCSLLELKGIYCWNYELRVYGEDYAEFYEAFVREFPRVRVEVKDKVVLAVVGKEDEGLAHVVEWVEERASGKWSISQESLGRVFYGLSSS